MIGDERMGKWIYRVNDLLYEVEFSNDILNGKYEIRNIKNKQNFIMVNILMVSQ